MLLPELTRTFIFVNLLLAYNFVYEWNVQKFPTVFGNVAYPWHFGTDPDPRIRTYLWLTDPVLDPAIFISDLQDGNFKLIIN